MRSHLRTALVLVVTVGLLAFFLRDVNLTDVWEKTREADARLLVAGVAVTLMTYALRAFRWQYLLAPIGPTRFVTAFQTTVIGFMVSQSERFGHWYPWSMPVQVLAGQGQWIDFVLVAGSCGGLLVALLGLLDFRRLEFE